MIAEFVISNESSIEEEGLLGDFSVFSDIAAAEAQWEHWVSEEPSVRFYDTQGERLIAVDHGDGNFHLEKTGAFFEGFADLVRQATERAGLTEPEVGLSVERALQALWEREQKFQREHSGMLGWFLPPRSFRERHGFWKWYIPSVRSAPLGSGAGIRRHRPWEIHCDDKSFWARF